MANSLNRELKIGDKVTLLNGHTVIVAEQTFGNLPFTSGTALMVRGPDEPETVAERISGFDIDPDATMREHAVANGWSPA